MVKNHYNSVLLTPMIFMKVTLTLDLLYSPTVILSCPK